MPRGEIGELVGVGATTLDKWRKLYSEGGVSALRRTPSSTGVRERCKALEERIVARRSEQPDHGVRRIRDDLRREEGLSVSAEKVRTTLNEAGLGNPPPTPKPKPPRKRRVERPSPNAHWQIAIFTFPLKRMYPVYLVGIIDDHSRYIAGWGLFRQQSAQAVLEVVKGAIGQWGAPREILSDNGRQFVAWRGKTRFQKVLKQQGIQHVRSAPHHPMTLGKIERFWQTIWKEFLEESVFASFADACQRLDHWIAYYNHQRPHQGIEGGCPADRFYGLSEDVDEALRQGCQENSLRLALGQEPQPPLYLLGQMGGTDVRVMRRGEEIEVKVGDSVHEVIRLGAPFRIDEKGTSRREGQADEMEGIERGRTLQGGGAGPDGQGEDPGAVQELRGESPDTLPGHRGSGAGRHGGAGAEEIGSEAEATGASEGGAPGGREDPSGEGAFGDEDPLRGDADDPGFGAQAGSRGVPAGGKKEGVSPTPGHEAGGFELPWSIWEDATDGPEE